MEAMIRALSERIEKMAIPSQSPPLLSTPVSLIPNPVGIPSPLIPIRNRRFYSVLAVETYRLRDRSPVFRAEQVASLTSYANQIRPRLSDCVFNGDSPLQVLPFLKQLVRVADQSFLSEAILLWVVDDFLRTPVKEAFRAQTLDTWPAAVHWLLTTYAPETSLESAVRKMQVAGQQLQEAVRQYGHRLQMEAAALGSLMTQAEVKSLFSQGLQDPVKSLFAANQPSTELDDSTPLSVLVGRAELLETGTRLVSPSPSRISSRAQPQRSPILAVQAAREYADAPSEPPVDVMALAAVNAKVSSDQWTCFVCYKHGHGWLECPWLSRIPEQEKEDALLRRRKFMERFRTSSPSRSRPSSPSPRQGYNGSRPGSPMRQPFGAQAAKSENGPASPHQ